MYQCEYCSASFPTYYSLRSHKNGSARGGIPGCALISKSTIVGSDAPLDDVPLESAVAAAAAITTPVFTQHEICQRHQGDSLLGSPHQLRNLGSAECSYTGSADYGALVQALRNYSLDVLNSRGTKFWLLYLATRHLHNDEQRGILRLVNKLFASGIKKGWCPDKRAVRNLLQKKPFWPLVTYTYTCDLSAFNVPGLGVVTYKFIDPIFAWILQARKLCKKYHLLFRYREARKKGSGEQTWGSCVSCGGAMREVTYPMYPNPCTFTMLVHNVTLPCNVNNAGMRENAGYGH